MIMFTVMRRVRVVCRGAKSEATSDAETPNYMYAPLSLLPSGQIKRYDIIWSSLLRQDT